MDARSHAGRCQQATWVSAVAEIRQRSCDAHATKPLLVHVDNHLPQMPAERNTPPDALHTLMHESWKDPNPKLPRSTSPTTKTRKDTVQHGV